MTTQERVTALDAFRGFTMVWMISEGFGLRVFEKHAWLGAVASQFEHVAWEGMTAWDLIQPFFMFIVGVAMPFSFGKRWAAGETWNAALRHVLKRSALLIFWGLVARSVQAGRPRLDLINVLAQLAVTYLIAFLLLKRPFAQQALGAAGLLLATAAFYMGFAPEAAWVRQANFGAWLDMAVLGSNWGGGYATFNCIPSAFNTVAGMMAGHYLMQAPEWGQLWRRMGAWALGLGGAGLALGVWIPVIKKIWTPSFALLSTGCCLAALLLFYWYCEVRRARMGVQILVIVGSNSIFIYLFHEILGRWLNQQSKTFLSWTAPALGDWTSPLMACAAIGFQVWVCVWLWRRRIFFKL